MAARPEQLLRHIRRLARSPDPGPDTDAGLLARFVTRRDDSDRFAVREAASREQERLDMLAEPVLRRASDGRVPLERRRRLEWLLERLRQPVTAPDLRRAVRVVAVLEHAGTPQARRLLERLAGGAAEARLTREAQAALRRLAAGP